MAGNTIMGEGLLAVRYSHGGSRQGIRLFLISNENMVLGGGHDSLLQTTRRCRLAAAQRQDNNSRNGDRDAAHRYSATCRVKVIAPCPEPQKTEQWPMKSPVLYGVKRNSVV